MAELNLLDVMVDIGEGFAKAKKLRNSEEKICVLNDCIENAAYMIEYGDSERIYLCTEHFNYLRTNTLAYAGEDIRENAKEIRFALDGKTNVTLLYFGNVNEILPRTNRYLRNMGLLGDGEELEPEILLTVLNSLDSIAFVGMAGDMVFGYSLEILGDEKILTESEWNKVLEGLGETEL